jgi:7-keto-8-aminopelargonate synthetase-like enzyme
VVESTVLARALRAASSASLKSSILAAGASASQALRKLKIPRLQVMENPSHIVPMLVGDPVLTKRITDALLDRFAIDVQPINYQTMPRSIERLRITPTAAAQRR